MVHSWDIVVWAQENTIDYVPSSWANHTKTKYKYPVGKNDFKMRKIINNNGSLENEPFEWFDAVCKVEYVKDLQKAKELCDKGQYTSNLEITDQECDNEGRKKKRKIIKRLTFDSDSSDGNVPLVRGQNLIRKKFSSEPLNSQQTSSILKNTHENDTCLSENRKQFSSSPNYHKRFSNQNSESNTTVSRLALFSNQTPSSSNPGLRQVSSGSRQISNDLAPLLEELTEIKFYMKETKVTLSKMEHFMNNCSNKNNFADQSTMVDTSNVFLEKLPCDSKKQLEEVDALIAEPTLMKELVNFLYLAGGTNAHKSVYLAMNKLFAKELALQYSGQGKKKKIPFCNMKLYQAIFAAIRKRHNSVTDDEIKKSVSLFLATSKSRLGGKRDSLKGVEEDFEI
ncbi:unnamed protein product [Brassicogethes aeneus]|uniref:DUF4806 domain-containing protein n=1 Tax=Brassicogethes aeneus TaxID=1431903 RepID=A0A9P0BI74_BRAAE|nr:unnamed protein product [Brassicogethes aeneus]